jgi:hypothetical protein
MKKVFSLCACVLGITCLLLGQTVMAQPDPNMRDRMEQRRDARTDGSQDSRQDPRSTKLDAPVGPKLTLCPGEYAYCGASTCRPTGRKIKVKVDGGKKTKEYDESECKCPIITKEMAVQNGVELAAFAALEEGNMKGSCARPGPGKIWSIAGVGMQLWPQESTQPPFQTAQVAYQQCPAGTKGSNCWNYECKIDPKPINGVKVATCFCAIGSSYLGQPVDPNLIIMTGAGSHYPNPSTACSQYPVSSEQPAKL